MYTLTQINQLTHKIIGCAMTVYNILGCGFQEVIYQRALSIELNEAGIKHIREKEIIIMYKKHQVGLRRADFLIEENIILEIKAVQALEDVHKAQAINYLEAYQLADGLLINFGSTKLEFKRMYNKRLRTTGYK